MDISVYHMKFRESIQHCAAEMRHHAKAMDALSTQLEELLLMCCPLRVGDVVILKTGTHQGVEAQVKSILPGTGPNSLLKGRAHYAIFVCHRAPAGDWESHINQLWGELGEDFDIVSQAADEAVSEG